jgi:hypothetical protein
MTKSFRSPLTIGADPELFLKKDGNFVSGHDKLPGTKHDPYLVKDGALQVDGTALEFNIDPADTAEKFVERIGGVINIMSAHIRHIDKNLKIVAEPVAFYTPEYWKDIPDEAKVLGCEPDWNAWTGQINPKPNENVSFRTGSGHIHIGWTEDKNPRKPDHFHDCLMAMKQMDCILYPMSFTWDDDRKRRELYGKPGAFRPKPYGAEYRVLSNAWLQDPDIMEWMFGAVQHGMHMLEDRVHLFDKSYCQKAVCKEDFSNKELRHYHGFLVDQGFAALPEGMLDNRVHATVS